MKPTHIEHLGIAVTSLEATMPFFEFLTGSKCYNIEEVADQKVKTAFFKVGEVKISNIYYSHQEITVYSEARNIHSNKEAMACDSNSLNISPDDLVMSDNVKVEWILLDKIII